MCLGLGLGLDHELVFHLLKLSWVDIENTRASYPIEYIPNARIPCVGPHPKNVILLACDAFGVLPPVSKLTLAQTMYHFISGYTALVHNLSPQSLEFNQFSPRSKGFGV